MESDPGSISQWIVLLILLALSAFFSAAETAFTSLGKLRLKNMVMNDVKGVALVEKILDDKQTLLSSILVGNNLVNLSASAIATSMAIGLSGNNNLVIGAATGLITFCILLFGEITPKTFAAQNAEAIVVLAAGPVYFCMKLFGPVVAVLNAITCGFIKLLGGDVNQNTPVITEADLKTIVNVSHEAGVLEVDEKRMINNVFEFGDSRAKDVMVPRMDIVAVDCNATSREIMKLFDDERVSRIPVYKESNDNIVGILNLKDFVFSQKFLWKEQKEFAIEEYLREPYFTYENKSIAELFTLMKTNRIRMAIVLDEYGGTSGLLTLEDIIEEIMGEISDEYDDMDDEIQLIREHEYVVDGSAKIDDVNEMIGISLTSEDYDSIGGYVMGLFNRIPEVNEQIEDPRGKIRFIIEETDKNRIEKLRIHT